MYSKCKTKKTEESKPTIEGTFADIDSDLKLRKKVSLNVQLNFENKSTPKECNKIKLRKGIINNSIKYH